MAVRYAIVSLLFGSLALFLLFGYWHAKRRIRRGLPPLRYHRWMVRQHLRRAQMGYPHYRTGSGYQYPMPQNGQGYRQAQYGAAQSGYGYPMESYAPPPPAYNVNDALPPVYQPPEGASKVAADQGYVHVAPLPPTPGEAAGEGSSSPPGVRQ